MSCAGKAFLAYPRGFCGRGFSPSVTHGDSSLTEGAEKREPKMHEQ